MSTLARVLLILVLVSGCGPRPGTAGDGRAAVAMAAKYLWSKQSPDGGWHSETYGLLRSGQSLTPFLLAALLGAPDPPKEAVGRAVAFIRASMNEAGEVGRADPSLEDYPNFATSLAVLALVRAGRTAGVDRMAAALRRQQFSEAGGWGPDHPAYGAWGMGGPLRTPPHTGHLDLSMTRHALQAMAISKAPWDGASRAMKYLERCRNEDGGFLFSTVILDANKAGAGTSYGTATADGVLALLALQAPPEQVKPPLLWLSRHHRVDGVPGFDDRGAKWRQGMLYYYLAASSQAFQQSGGGPAGWAKEMIHALTARQREDGSFKNESFLMKEDDPFLATGLALLALTSATS